MVVKRGDKAQGDLVVCQVIVLEVSKGTLAAHCEECLEDLQGGGEEGVPTQVDLNLIENLVEGVLGISHRLT